MKFSLQEAIAIPADVLELIQSKNHKTAAGIGEAMGLLERITTLRKRREFESEIQRTLEPAMRLAIRLTGNSHDAEVLVQETMLRAIRKWETFRGDSSFKTWLYRILINQHRDQWRRKPQADFVPLDEQSAATHESAENQFQASELSDVVAELISQLPERQREVLVLSTYETMTPEEIATTLQINVANVYANLSTARRKLKQQLAPHLDRTP